ncbi:MAG: hypothetical protein WCS67_07730 [Bacteroidales bacterium]
MNPHHLKSSAAQSATTVKTKPPAKPKSRTPSKPPKPVIAAKDVPTIPTAATKATAARQASAPTPATPKATQPAIPLAAPKNPNASRPDHSDSRYEGNGSQTGKRSDTGSTESRSTGHSTRRSEKTDKKAIHRSVPLQGERGA